VVQLPKNWAFLPDSHNISVIRAKAANMKWRHWAILIALVLLNYIIFSCAFTQLAKQRNAAKHALRTPKPTFESVEQNPVAWIVLPTSTQLPSLTPIIATATEIIVAVAEVTPTAVIVATETAVTATPMPTATLLPTATPTPATVQHEVQAGETLGEIAQVYNVTVDVIVVANNLSNADRISAGQLLIIPVSDSVPPTAEVEPTAAPPTNTPKPKPPTPKPTPQPPTPTPTPVPARNQFTSTLIWDPMVAPNCAGPGISKHSIIRDAGGNPVNGARVEVNCYDNIWLSHPTGNPGEYDPGHYDFSFGQTKPQAWTCTARVLDINGQPVTSSEVATIEFDTNDCSPGGSGHQIAILNWTQYW
jgi:LysM repeat protein